MAPSEYAKAITGGVLAGLTALGAALPDGVTGAELVGIVIAAVGTFASVFGVPNTRRDPTRHKSHRTLFHSESRGESGQAPFNTLAYLLACAVLAFVLVWLFAELVDKTGC